MKVVLFCGGLGTRIREYSENVPKPMVPIGHQPILWHVMNYYSHFGHQDFVLCLGYKASVIKEFFLKMRPEMFEDCVVSKRGKQVQLLEEVKDDWRVTMIDTGVWRNIGQRLMAVREHVRGEEMFLANYSDGLSDIDLNMVVEQFKKSDKYACFVAVRPPLTYHLVDIEEAGRVREFRSSDTSDIWINGGFFIFRQEIFDYIEEGEELVIQPFQRLIEADRLMAFKHTGFWRSMDTLRDRQVLVDMIERGEVPWQIDNKDGMRQVQAASPQRKFAAKEKAS